MRAEGVLERRRAERAEFIEQARQYVAELEQRLPIRAAVVFGSVARGDFNLWSDTDLLLISDAFRGRLLDRRDQVEPRPPRVQPIPWTVAEWHAQLARRNPIATESLKVGVWLAGSADHLADGEFEWEEPGSP